MVNRLTAAEALSVQETCEVGGFGKSTFYVLVNSGLLPAKKLGKKTLVLRSDLLKFLATLPSAAGQVGRSRGASRVQSGGPTHEQRSRSVER